MFMAKEYQIIFGKHIIRNFILQIINLNVGIGAVQLLSETLDVSSHIIVIIVTDPQKTWLHSFL